MAVSRIPEDEPEKDSQVLEIFIHNPEALKIFKALASETRLKILNLVSPDLCVYSLAEKIKQTEANVSAQVKILEKVGILAPIYQPGKHGVKKTSKKVYKTIIIKFVED
jgi:predicted transcriptional regulator